ncbi:hypothetical protein BP5796_12698 [Coleophoma crateriformis]|uniref:Amino acid transporter transmembrane domain-containing protein n=1 Tax=Coleophoma crateriformis TaxID=565419 RepID=A0A3D8Q6H5_9HELO|nr:hypothetical protein BP5796_12698 [Coleophoma crateriformis]
MDVKQALTPADIQLDEKGHGTVETFHVGETPNKGILLEEYLYWASITRAQEAQYEDEGDAFRLFRGKLTKKSPAENNTPTPVEISNGTDEKNGHAVDGVSTSPTTAVSDEEWAEASRGIRTATWSAVFYLVTADIMGPSSAPWAIAQLGYGPGISLYVIFGIVAGTGWLLWQMFLKLDSEKYPLKTYGDLAFRVFGSKSRHFVNVLQSIEILSNVGVILLGNSQGLSQVVIGKVCFSVLCLIWAIAGMVIGQIRTLQKLSYLTSLNLWMTILTLCMTMGIISHSAPSYATALASNGVAEGPVITTGGVPPGSTFNSQIVGLMQAVYSYGGAVLFLEFMSEMKRPWDFWKSLMAAQVVILTVYLTFGIFVYTYQGQFAINPAGQGISNFTWLCVINVIGMVAGIISGALYGNIGIKVIYQTVIKDAFNGPELNSSRGKLIWAGMVPLYWSLAFVIASAIPQFSNIQGFIGALCILQFSYTFPPLLKLGFDIQAHAILPGETFDPVTRQVNRMDKGFTRWARGMKHQWYIKLALLLFVLASASTAILGMYSSTLAIIAGFKAYHAASAFGCVSPVIG